MHRDQGQKLKLAHGDSPATGASSNRYCDCRGPGAGAETCQGACGRATTRWCGCARGRAEELDELKIALVMAAARRSRAMGSRSSARVRVRERVYDCWTAGVVIVRAATRAGARAQARTRDRPWWMNSGRMDWRLRGRKTTGKEVGGGVDRHHEAVGVGDVVGEATETT